MRFRLNGLVAATHTPFAADGSLNLNGVEAVAAHLAAHRVEAVFINGTTGESSSLTVAERLDLAERWAGVARGTGVRVVVHVGANCLEDARVLATQADRLGVGAIAAVAPSYFKPRDADALVATMAAIASAAPSLPFYYYEIPGMTGVGIAPSEFLERASSRIPNLVGMKYSSGDLLEYQLCRSLDDGRFDLPFGSDETLLAALALGATGAVGSTYNFAAPLYHRLIAAFDRGDLASARREQMRSAQMVRRLARHGWIAATKATMELLGVPVGPPRLPNPPLDAAGLARLRADLDELGFFDTIAR